MNRFAEANFARINNKAGFLMGIIRRVKEDGPDGGGADLKILPRSVEHAIRGLMDEVRLPITCTTIDRRIPQMLASPNHSVMLTPAANMDWKRHREMSKCLNIETYIEYPNI